MELLITKTGDSLARGIPCPSEVFTYYFICLLDNQGEMLKRHNLQANTLNYSQLCHLGVQVAINSRGMGMALFQQTLQHWNLSFT